jgi:hypothetical protein
VSEKQVNPSMRVRIIHRRDQNYQYLLTSVCIAIDYKGIVIDNVCQSVDLRQRQVDVSQLIQKLVTEANNLANTFNENVSKLRNGFSTLGLSVDEYIYSKDW